jgi:replicative DNA helicase
MGAEALALRLIGSEGRIEGARLRVGCLRDEDWPKVARAASTLSEAPVWIDDSGGVTLGYIRAELARHVEQHGPVNVVVIDYLQLMSHENPRLSPEQVVTENCKGLKQLAKEHNATVILLSQLNRALEQRQDKRPIMSDLKQSSGIEQDADVIIFIYRDVVYNPETDKPKHAELIIGKQRNGALGTAHVAFLGEYTRFENLAPEDAGGFSRE